MFSLIPREVRLVDLFEQQSQHSIESAQPLHDLVHHFDDARAKAHAMKEVEHRADNLLRDSLAALFEEQADPSEVIEWKEIYAWLVLRLAGA